MSDFTMELAAPELQIENEIKQGLTQTQVAMTYAMAMCVRSRAVDFKRMNAAIVAKWPDSLEAAKQGSEEWQRLKFLE